MKYILFISQMFLGLLATGQLITGTVTNSNGEPLPFVSVSVLEDGIGTSTDYKGNYSLQLLNLNGEVSFSFVGYKTHIEIFDLGLESNKRIDVVLESSSISLDEAEVVSNTRDRAREIMKLARANRARHLDSLENFSLSIYQRISLTNELKRPSMKDTLELYRVEETDDGGRNPFLPELREIKEIQSKIYYQAPQKYKEFIYGINVYEEGEMPDEDDDVGRSASAGSTLEFGENVVVPQFQRADEPWILFEGADCFKINLYKTLISIDQVADKPILSPLAGTSAVAYKFDYKGTDFTSGEKQYIIQVTPLNSLENLFSGLIWLDAEDYSIRKLDLTLEGSLKLCNEIRLIYDFESKDSNYVPSGIYIEYSVRQGRRDDVVRVECAIDSVVMSPDLGSVKFNGEFKVIDKKAFDQGSEFWSVNRTIGLDSTTVKFVQKSDSIKAYYESPKYLHKLDSAFNKIDIWTPLIGLGHRNRVKGTEWYVEGLLGQVVPFGIGGYRHRLPGYFEKDVGDSYTYRISGHADYGFTNKDLKGKANLEFTYNPRKFLKTTISFGDYYDMINDFASLEQTFSRSNYVRTKMVGLSQRMEILNGLYAELTFEYQDQLPLDNLEFSDWSEETFEDLNTPINFERYTKSELRLQAQYRIKQEYYFKGDRKMVIPSKLPEITFLYRKGIPNLFNSEVDFDFLQIGAFQEIELGRFGSTRWNFEFGTFLNKRDLRTLEYKYFRGSDNFLFSDPLRSFQVLGPTLNTPNEYIRINGIHHFEGTILNKIPLIRRLKMGLAVGAGSLAIPDSDFYHAEAFIGIEKSFRLFKEMVRMGVYAVNGEASIESPDLTYKVGFTFYNNFTRKWGY